MKLEKVFSNQQFKNVSFNEGYNIVLANIQDTRNKKDTHNLGKTSLLYVIDFLLLNTFSRKSALLANDVFAGQIFYLEVKLNQGGYLVIRRGVSAPSKISFKRNQYKLTDFIPPAEWDDEDVPFMDAKQKLNEYLAFDVLVSWPFRKSITYFLRTQKDYLDVFQLGKFTGKHIYWKPFVFDLLGFDGDLVRRKLEKDEEIEKRGNEIRTLQKQANIDVAERDKIVGLLDVKTQEKERAEAEIDKFNFYSQDKGVTKQLIESIDVELQQLNAERYRLSHEIKKINESLSQIRPAVRLSKLKDLYDEVSLFFPESLSKRFEELESFTDSISSERQKYLVDNLTRLQDELVQINFQIQRQQNQRSEKISLLTEADVYSKFKVYQKELATVEGELKLLSEKLRLIDNTSTIRAAIETLRNERKECVAAIGEAIDGRAHAEINRIFNQIITEVTGNNAIISIKQNSDGNVEFDADYQTTTNITTSEADGTSYKKLLCVAFDLSLLIHNAKHSFYRFVYHDGVMEGLDDRIKIRLLNVTQRICNEYGLQYILTIINSDIPKYTNGFEGAFPYSSVCLKLSDEDDSGKLFGISF